MILQDMPKICLKDLIVEGRLLSISEFAATVAKINFFNLPHKSLLLIQLLHILCFYLFFFSVRSIAIFI